MTLASSRRILATPVALGLLLASCASPGRGAPLGAEATNRSAVATEMVVSAIGAAEVDKVRAEAWRLSTRSGAHVQVVRARLGDVWVKFYPDVSDNEKEAFKARDVLVIRSTDHVPLGQDSETPGMTPAPIGVRSVVIDAVTGAEVTWSDAGVDQADKFDNRLFGPTTDVTLP